MVANKRNGSHTVSRAQYVSISVQSGVVVYTTSVRETTKYHETLHSPFRQDDARLICFNEDLAWLRDTA